MNVPDADVVTRAAAARARCSVLIHAGERLAARPRSETIRTLVRAAACWSDARTPERRSAVRDLADEFHVPEASIEEILDATFPLWTVDSLTAWVEHELGAENTSGCATPRLVVVLASLGVPTTPVSDLLTAALVGAAVWIKPAAGSDDLVARFAETIEQLDPVLGAAIETARWPADGLVADAILGASDVVVATGRATTIETVRARLGESTRLIEHGPRMSVAVVTREALAASGDRVVDALARDTAHAGQMGCLSPIVAYVEADHGSVAELGGRVRDACERRWPAVPRTSAPVEEGAAWAEWRAGVDIGIAAGTSLTVFGGSEAAWSLDVRRVATPPEPPPTPRILTMMPIRAAAETGPLLEAHRGWIACAGVATTEERWSAIESMLSMAGVERVARLGRMQRPCPGWWRDGRPPLADLVGRVVG